MKSTQPHTVSVQSRATNPASGLDSKASHQKGALLLNLGSPEAPDVSSVRRYLRDFLMDPWVIDLAWPLRWFLVHALILPRRPQKSAKAYQKIWTERGSPLRYHLQDLVNQVQTRMGAGWWVQGAMRYGSPSIRDALREFQIQGVQDLTIFPLYPQFSLAATQSSILECQRLAKEIFPEAKLKFIPAFYADSGFIESFAEVIQENLKNYPFDHLLFSFHGLPERQIRKTDSSKAYCFSMEKCCEGPGMPNPDCYRAQCFTTARLIGLKLGIEQKDYTVCFQSRMGTTPWIKPYTDQLYETLPKKGVRRLAVVCPAFVADCLETLEEVQIRGREQFLAQGGEDLRFIPSLNSTDRWTQTVCTLLEES